MDGIGFLSLGVGAGMLTCLMVSRARASASLSFVLAALLPVLLSGAAVLLTPQLASSKSASLYPLGLLVSLIWQQVLPLINALDHPRFSKYIAIACGIGTLILTLVAILLAWSNRV